MTTTLVAVPKWMTWAMLIIAVLALLINAALLRQNDSLYSRIDNLEAAAQRADANFPKPK